MTLFLTGSTSQIPVDNRSLKYLELTNLKDSY